MKNMKNMCSRGWLHKQQCGKKNVNPTMEEWAQKMLRVYMYMISLWEN